jgi:hypothetical protein
MRHNGYICAAAKSTGITFAKVRGSSRRSLKAMSPDAALVHYIQMKTPAVLAGVRERQVFSY